MGKDSAEFVTKLPAPEPAKKSGLPGFLIGGTVLALAASALVYAQLEWSVLDQVLAKKTEQAAVEPAPQAEDEKPSIASGRKAKKPARVTTAQAAEAPRKAVREREPPATAAPPVAIRRFPAAGDIQKGMSLLSLRQTFGAPDMKTTDSDRGRLLERWMYMNRELGAVTVVLIADGKVVSADTSGAR